jgi:hypothetical protein
MERNWMIRVGSSGKEREMLQLAATLVTLMIFGGALSLVAVTLRANSAKIVRALAGLPVAPVPPLPARAMRVTVRPPMRLASPQPLRAAA